MPNVQKQQTKNEIQIRFPITQENKMPIPFSMPYKNEKGNSNPFLMPCRKTKNEMLESVFKRERKIENENES